MTRRLLATFVMLVVAVVAVLVAALSPALADKRVALLIGNSAYASATRLGNPANDVAAMADLFRGAGFDHVSVNTDLDERGMRAALQAFEETAAGADVAVIFYSGHGIEMNGQNYLIPVDARLGSDRAIDDEAVPLDRVLRSMEQVRRLRLVILDACRDNPFVNAMVRTSGSRSVGRGLARIEPQSVDTMVAYAAKAGTVAEDGVGRNSPFTAALLRHLAEPGLDVRLALGQVRDDVLQATRNRQEPFVYGSLGGSVLPINRAAPAPPTPPAPKPQASASVQGTPAGDACGSAAAHWSEARAFDRIEFYEEHLRLFGSCAFAGFARARIESLSSGAAVASRMPAPSPPSAPPTPAPSPAPAQAALPAPAPVASDALGDCDRLAGRPFDPAGRGEGVSMTDMDAAAAAAACEKAMKASSEPRFAFQMGRAAYRQKQYVEATGFYGAAADKGYAAAVTALAFAYAEGTGVPLDIVKAESLYRRAAALGDTQALHNLGWMFERGQGVKRDPRQAATFVMMAIEKGNKASLALVSGNSQLWSPEFRKEIQSQLHERKLYAGPIDGQFNEPTLVALRTIAGQR